MADDIVETGLVAAAVTLRAAAVAEAPPEPEPVSLPAVVASAGKVPSGWTLPMVAGLVTDVAQNLYDEPYLLSKHKLTAQEYETLKANEFFKRALEAETLVWQSTNSIQKRLALEAAIAVEAALPTVAARLSKGTEPLADVVSLLKVLSEIAGTIGAKAAVTAANTDKFKIIINMGADVVAREATGNTISIQPLPEGESTGHALRALVQAPGEGAPVQHQP